MGFYYRELFEDVNTDLQFICLLLSMSELVIPQSKVGDSKSVNSYDGIFGDDIIIQLFT